MLARGERPPALRSRVHGARHLLGELRRLRVKLDLAHGLAGTLDEKRWCLSTADKLDTAITAGEAVLGGFADPRPARKARKRPGLFERSEEGPTGDVSRGQESRRGPRITGGGPR